MNLCATEVFSITRNFLVIESVQDVRSYYPTVNVIVEDTKSVSVRD